jgi:O-antigen/teichoic acid export membrane protein
VKDIYRMTANSVKKFEQRMILTGVVLIVPFLLISYFSFNYLYKFEIGTDYMVYFVLYFIPVYFYIIPVYNLYKSRNQNKVIIITVSGIVIGLISNILLIPVFELKGALISNIISQIIMMIMYFILNVKLYYKLIPEKN